MKPTSGNFSEKYNCIWLAPPRTGTRGLTRIFHFLGFQNVGNPNKKFDSMNYTHGYPTLNEFIGHDVIISVRNPYGRLYSLYENYFKTSATNYKTFEKFIDDLDEAQLNMPTFKIFTFPVNFVVRLENQYEDLIKIPFVRENFTDKQLKLMTTHEKEIHDWTKEYSPKMKEKVYYFFKYQFDAFGYKK